VVQCAYIYFKKYVCTRVKTDKGTSTMRKQVILQKHPIAAE
jgi:hypothetical protein